MSLFASRLFAAASLLLLLMLPPAVSRAESPQDGEVTANEAEVLWKRATSEYEAGRYESAAHDLRRLTSRVPTHAHALEALKLLGEAELKLRRYPDATKAFQTYLNNTQGRGESSNIVRTLLAETHLQAGRPTEALLISEKMLSKAQAQRWNRPLDSQIHKVRGLLGLKQDKRAESALKLARARPLAQSGDPEWASDWMSSLELQIKARQCDAFLIPENLTTLDEGQVIERLKRHKQCIAELANLYSRRPESASLASVQAISANDQARKTFERACEGPARAPKKVAKTAEEQGFYLRELRRKLAEICSSQPE